MCNKKQARRPLKGFPGLLLTNGIGAIVSTFNIGNGLGLIYVYENLPEMQYKAKTSNSAPRDGFDDITGCWAPHFCRLVGAVRNFL